MEDRRTDYPYNQQGLSPYQRSSPARPSNYPPSFGADAMKDAQMLTQGGFKPLSKEEREEAAQIALEAGFSLRDTRLYAGSSSPTSSIPP